MQLESVEEKRGDQHTTREKGERERVRDEAGDSLPLS